MIKPPGAPEEQTDQEIITAVLLRPGGADLISSGGGGDIFPEKLPGRKWETNQI